MRTLGRVWPYLKKCLGLLLFGATLMGLTAGLGILSPQVIRWVVDHVIGTRQWQWLLPGAAAVVGLSLLQGGVRFGQRYLMEYVSQQIVYNLRSDLYQHLQSLSFGFYDRAQTGELMSRVTADVEAVRQSLGMGFVNGVMHGTTVLGTIVLMFWMDWRLALVTLCFLPLLAHGVYMMGTRARPAYDAVQEKTAALSALLQENITGVRVVRAFAREDQERDRFMQANADFLDANRTAIRLNAFWSNYMTFLTALGSITLLWYGGRRTIAGEITVGTLIAFNTYVANLIHPVRSLGWVTSMYSRAGAGAKRIFELLDTRSEVRDRAGAAVLDRARGHVRFDGVSFRYEEGEPVLDNVSLEVQPGLRVAVLGITGSGKSTLVHLIPRFYDPTGGRVLLDGTDVRDYTLESLRRNVAIVLQETFLFSTTLRENIAYGKPDAAMEDIVAAARAAQIHDFIAGLPKGYETVVGERGVGLSGGQKQRVAIARALLLDSPLLVMDESTSAVDVHTEQLIQAAMDRVMHGRTAFIIASRLSTVKNADLVIVLDQGRIAEQGTHADLIQRDGLYRQVYELQLKPAEQCQAEWRGVGAI